jgi:hypothetical protein
VAQLVVPCAFVQALPHEPQFARLVDELISHPSEYCELQFKNGAVHDWTEQVVPMQAGVPFWTPHTFVQLPQALTLLVVGVSQPFVALASQLP